MSDERTLFDIQLAPADLEEIRAERSGNASPRDVRFASPRGGRVGAYLVEPGGGASGPALLFLHWGFGSRESFLGEARAWARAGALALCMDAPGYGSRPGGIPRLTDAAVATRFVEQCVTDLRRAVDVLVERGATPGRIAYVGHSLGAAVGGQLAGAERRLGAFVLMGGSGEISRSWRPHPPEAYVEALAPYDGVRHIGRAAGARFLFQFARRDAFISEREAHRFFDAAPEPKRIAFYDASHAFCPQATRERAAFLAEALGLAPPPERELDALRPPMGELIKHRIIAPMYRLAFRKP